MTVSEDVKQWFFERVDNADDWFMEYSSEWTLELERGVLQLDLVAGCVYVYSGLGFGVDYGFELHDPSVELLEQLFEAGGGEL